MQGCTLVTLPMPQLRCRRTEGLSDCTLDSSGCTLGWSASNLATSGCIVAMLDCSWEMSDCNWAMLASSRVKSVQQHDVLVTWGCN